MITYQLYLYVHHQKCPVLNVVHWIVWLDSIVGKNVFLAVMKDLLMTFCEGSCFICQRDFPSFTVDNPVLAQYEYNRLVNNNHGYSPKKN